MRFILLGIFSFFFVVIPLYILNTLVMPDLQSLQQTYETAGATAEAVTKLPGAND